MDCFAALAMTWRELRFIFIYQIHVRVLAARSTRALPFVVPPQMREQGMPDARCTRGLVCKGWKEKRTRAYRAAENIRHSLRNGFTAYGAITPENSWPLSPPSSHGNRHAGPVGPQHLARLDAYQFQASGPHAFAVRYDTARLPVL